MTRIKSIEDSLNSRNLKWEYKESIPLDKIDTEPVWRSQVRIEEPLDEDHAVSIMVALSKGAKLPAFLLRANPKKDFLYDGIDFRHRYYAMDIADVKEHDAYVVYCEAGDARELAIEANSSHGKNFSHQEKLAHALALMAKGYTMEDAARENNVKTYQLREYKHRTDFRAQLKSRGASNKVADYFYDEAGNETISKLRTIRNIEAQVLASELIAVKDIRGKNVKSLIESVKEGEEKGKPIESLDSWRAENITTKSSTRVARQPVYITSILRHSSAFSKVSNDISSNHLLDLTSSELKSVWESVNKAEKAARNLKRSLNNVATEKPSSKVSNKLLRSNGGMEVDTRTRT